MKDVCFRKYTPAVSIKELSKHCFLKKLIVNGYSVRIFALNFFAVSLSLSKAGLLNYTGFDKLNLTALFDLPSFLFQ